VADLCEELINNPERAIKIGQAGKKTAQELFSWNRYAKEWEEFLNFVINDFKSKKKL
jgi:glycosyltransferase involved in cell wall biosynthesis